MLVFDDSLSAALMNVAASENLVTHSLDRSQLYNDPTTAKFLAKGTDAKLRRQALFDLLLHCPAILSPFDNLDDSELRRHGLVEGQLQLSDQTDAYRQLETEPNQIRAIQELIVADIAADDSGLNSDQFVVKYLSLRSSKGYSLHGKLSSAMYGLFDTYDDYIAGVKTIFGDSTYALPGRDAFSISGSQLEASITADASREDFEAFKEYEKHRSFMADFQASAQKWIALTNVSRRLEAVLSAKLPDKLLAPRKGLTLELLQKQLQLRADQGSSHVAVRIWMDEVLSAPRLTSIEDVLRLREDKRIGAFRTAMAEWTECLAHGSPAEEARLRKLIGTANKEVAKLKRIEPVTNFFTFASVPLDVLLVSKWISLDGSCKDFNG